MLISFDGLDSSGKATQTRLLAQHLTTKGIQNSLFTSPDYETQSGKELKLRLQNKLGNWQHTPWEEKMGYFAANRAEHRDEVSSLLGAGNVVLYDRYVVSSIAFMIVEAAEGNISDALRQQVHRAVEDLEYETNGMPKEDISVFFDIPPKIASRLLKGRKKKNGDDDEYTDYLAVQEALHGEYVRLAQEHPDRIIRIACMDNDRLRTVDEVAYLVRKALEGKFPEYNNYFL